MVDSCPLTHDRFWEKHMFGGYPLGRRSWYSLADLDQLGLGNELYDPITIAAMDCGKWHGVAGYGMVWIGFVGRASKCHRYTHIWKLIISMYCIYIYTIFTYIHIIIMCTLLTEVLLKLFLLPCLSHVCLRFAEKSQPPPWLLSPCKQEWTSTGLCSFLCSLVRSSLIHLSTHWLMGSLVLSFVCASIPPCMGACVHAWDYVFISAFAIYSFRFIYMSSCH